MTQIDVSVNTNLRGIDCSSNGLKCLNVKNSNNANFIFFEASSNKDLQCLDVDDELLAAANWSNNVDPGVVFSTFCATPCSASLLDVDENEMSFNVYPNPTNNTINLSSSQMIHAIYVELFDCFGRLVMTSNSSQMNLGSLSQGTYFLVANVNGKMLNSRVVKQ